MQMTIEIPEMTMREAELRGVAVEEVVHERLQKPFSFASLPGFTRFGGDGSNAAEAAARIRENRKGQTLGGEVTVVELVREGRPS